MNKIRLFVLPVFSGLLSGTLMFGGDLSTYRNFKIGMDLPTVARMARSNPSQAKTIHQRPALIQELEWHPSLFEASSQDEAAKDVLFSFYNGELFQIAVNYDRYRTEGMKSDDLIEAISATYGTARRRLAAVKVTSPDAYGADRTETIALWGDGEYAQALDSSGHCVRADIERLIGEVQPDQASFFMMMPLPGSKDHERMVQDGAPMESDYNRFDSFHESMPEGRHRPSMDQACEEQPTQLPTHRRVFGT